MVDVQGSYSLLDNNMLTKDCATYIGLVFEGALDGAYLVQKFRDLVHKWPIIGGKLVTKTNPYSFTTGDVVDVKLRHVDSDLDTFHPLARQKATKQNEPTSFACVNNDAKDHLFHFENTRPMAALPHSLVSLRITVLRDATLLGFVIIHHLADGTSQFDIIRHYCDLVNGIPIPDLTLPPDVSTKLSTLVRGEDKHLQEHEDVIANARNNCTTDLYSLVKFIAATTWKTWSPFRASEQVKWIYLPIELVEKWRVECQTQVDRETEQDPGHVQLTKNDVITSWFLMNSFKTIKNKANIPLNLCYPINPRRALDLPNRFFLKNIFFTGRIYASSFAKFQTMSHAQIALHIHRTVQAYLQPSYVRDQLEFWEEIAEKGLTAVGPLPQEGGDIDTYGMVSSWTTSRYDTLSLRGALKNKQEEASAKGSVIWTQPWAVLPGSVTLKPQAITIKDGEKGYWMRANNTLEAWKGFE